MGHAFDALKSSGDYVIAIWGFLNTPFWMGFQGKPKGNHLPGGVPSFEKHPYPVHPNPYKITGQ